MNKCSRIHRYALASPSGEIQVFDDPQEARDIKADDQFWVAFHEVGVQQLVNNPHTIESYCAQETQRQEEVKPGKVDLLKRS